MGARVRGSWSVLIRAWYGCALRWHRAAPTRLIGDVSDIMVLLGCGGCRWVDLLATSCHGGKIPVRALGTQLRGIAACLARQRVMGSSM